MGLQRPGGIAADKETVGANVRAGPIGNRWRIGHQTSFQEDGKICRAIYQYYIMPVAGIPNDGDLGMDFAGPVGLGHENQRVAVRADGQTPAPRRIVAGIHPHLPQRRPGARSRAAVARAGPVRLAPKGHAATVKSNIGIAVRRIYWEVQVGRGVGVHAEGEVQPAWDGVEIGEPQRRLLMPALPVGPVQHP